jgi:peptide chain release factor 1
VDPIFDKLEEVVDRLREVEGLLSDPQVASNQDRFRGLNKEHAELSPLVDAFNAYRQLCEEIAGHRELLQESDAELKEMVTKRPFLLATCSACTVVMPNARAGGLR